MQLWQKLSDLFLDQYNKQRSFSSKNPIVFLIMQFVMQPSSYDAEKKRFSSYDNLVSLI